MEFMRMPNYDKTNASQEEFLTPLAKALQLKHNKDFWEICPIHSICNMIILNDQVKDPHLEKRKGIDFSIPFLISNLKFG